MHCATLHYYCVCRILQLLVFGLGLWAFPIFSLLLLTSLALQSSRDVPCQQLSHFVAVLCLERQIRLGIKDQ